MRPSQVVATCLLCLGSAQQAASSVAQGNWTLLSPNPDLLEWAFKGYYWYGNRSTLPAGSDDLCRYPRLRACTEKEKTDFISKYKLKEEDFRMTLVGHLKVPLEYDDMKPSSNMTQKLRISAILGADGGAAAPVLLGHCGGPSSDDTCGMTTSLRPELLKHFTLFGIQQRGMSSGEPFGKYPHPEHAVDVEGKTFNGVCEGTYTLTPAKEKGKQYNLKDFTKCVCDLPDDPTIAYPEPFPDPTDEEKVRSWFAFSASRDKGCYKADYWKLSDGTHQYNFLDFVGTQLLAMDLDRFREAIGHKKLNILGWSYGTAVGASYMATFPHNSGNVVLNGNVHPGPGVDDYYESVAQASRQGMTKLVRICDRQTSFLPKATLDECQVPHKDEVAFFHEVVEKIAKNATGVAPSLFSAETELGGRFTLTPAVLYHYLSRLASFTAEVQKKWVDSLQTLILLGSDNLTEIKQATVTIFDQACTYSGDGIEVRAWYEYGYCWPVMFNTKETNDNEITSRAVRAADYVSRFTVDGAMDNYRRLARKYEPVEVYLANAKAGFGLQTWPGEATPGMIGFRAGVKPVIVNALYDMSTPYTNAKLMRQGFPDGVLMTWQGVGHCVQSADYDPAGVESCNARLIKYLVTGVQPPDGFTCRQTKYIETIPKGKPALALMV